MTVVRIEKIFERGEERVVLVCTVCLVLGGDGFLAVINPSEGRD